MANQLIDKLRLFNRKERYHVVLYATDGGFTISDSFIHDLQKINIPICSKMKKSDIFLAMDYHFDWIYASLMITQDNGRNDKFEIEENCIKCNQEDVDLIVAFPDKNDSSHTHLVMIEAKGDTSWLQNQADSKGKRLTAIFGTNKDRRWKNVTPYFVILSPKDTSLKMKNFPDWAIKSKKHMKLNMDKGLKKVTRCTPERVPSKDGQFWTINPKNKPL